MLIGLFFGALVLAIIGYMCHKKYRGVHEGLQYNPLDAKLGAASDNSGLPETQPPVEEKKVWQPTEEVKKEEKVEEADNELFAIQPLQAPVEPVTISRIALNDEIEKQNVGADPEEE